MNSFQDDRLENEKKDPIESSAPQFIPIPIILLSVFFGFGITYLALRTDRVTMEVGDSRTNPAVVATAAAPTQFDLAAFTEKGKQIFTTTCQACHQANGAGIPGAFPPLAESEWVNGPAKQVVAIILYGLHGEIIVKNQKFQNAMPAFKEQLKPEDVAAAATYIRQAFGNKSEAVHPEIVEQVLSDFANRTNAWNGEAELKTQKWD